MILPTIFPLLVMYTFACGILIFGSDLTKVLGDITDSQSGTQLRSVAHEISSN